MPILRPCKRCGRLGEGRFCPGHQHLGKRRDTPERNRRRDLSRKARGKRRGSSARYRKARAVAMARDGYRCTYVEDGVRCEATSDTHRLVTHHLNGDALDDRPENLATLCTSHHNRIERAKRGGR